MNLCIALPNQHTYSETFLSNQIKGLRPQMILSEGWYPSVLEDGRSFLPFPLNIQWVRGGLRNILPAFYHRKYSSYLASHFKRQGVDTVLANYGPMGVTLFDACQIAGIRLFVHFHGFDASDSNTLALYDLRYRQLLPHTNGVIVVSNDMKIKLKEFNLPDQKLHLNPYGVDTALFNGANPAAAEPVFIFAGRFTEKKAPMLTIKAFAKVVAEVPFARLIMLGTGELLVASKKMAQELSISKSIHFDGVKNPAEVSQYLKTARAFVQHSVRAPGGDAEGTPNTILEASATGLPVVSTRHGGIKEAVIHNKTGFLTAEGDWKTMADYMIKLAKDPLLAEKMGQAGRLHIIENYEMNTRITHLKEIIA